MARVRPGSDPFADTRTPPPRGRARARTVDGAGGAPADRGVIPLIFSPTFHPAIDDGAELTRRLASFNTEVAVAVNALTENMDLLAARLIGAETAHRALAADSQRVLASVVEQARNEFQQQADSANTLRNAIAQEAAAVRLQLEATQRAIGELHGGVQQLSVAGATGQPATAAGPESAWTSWDPWCRHNQAGENSWGAAAPPFWPTRTSSAEPAV